MAADGADQALAAGGRLRLAFVCHCLRPEDGGAGRIGGAERAAAELLAAFKARGDVEVRLIAASAASDRLAFLGFAGRALGELSRLARAGEIDAVLFTAFPTAWMSLFLAPTLRRHGVAMGAICHGHDITFTLPPYQWLLPRVFEALDVVLPVSRATGAECLARGVDPARLQVVFNGADLGRFATQPPFEARRGILSSAFPAEAAELGSDDFVICTVGRQVARKGHAWFVRDVMPRLKEGAKLWLAGDGPEAAAIAAAIRAAGVEARVRRLGAIIDAQLHALYRGADLMVMPNVPVPGDIEGFGLVLLEANLNGLPVVSADIEGPAEVVEDGVNGRLAKALDADAFVQAIEALRSDPAERRRLGIEGERYARETFGWGPVAQQHLEALERARARLRRPDAVKMIQELRRATP
jgi:phosphatidylinositol alpha-1,6-mannosyltransferase